MKPIAIPVVAPRNPMVSSRESKHMAMAQEHANMTPLSSAHCGGGSSKAWMRKRSWEKEAREGCISIGKVVTTASRMHTRESTPTVAPACKPSAALPIGKDVSRLGATVAPKAALPLFATEMLVVAPCFLTTDLDFLLVEALEALFYLFLAVEVSIVCENSS